MGGNRSLKLSNVYHVSTFTAALKFTIHQYVQIQSCIDIKDVGFVE